MYRLTIAQKLDQLAALVHNAAPAGSVATRSCNCWAVPSSAAPCSDAWHNWWRRGALRCAARAGPPATTRTTLRISL